MNCKCLSMARETSAETVSHAQNWQHVFTVREMSTSKRISTSDTQVNISGSGNVLLDGKSTEAEYHIAGSGDINATELKVENVNARISGSGSIRCYATENLTGGVSGSGNVAYKGNPQINFSKRGLQKL